MERNKARETAVKLTAGCRSRLDLFLAKAFPEFSRSYIEKIIKARLVSVNHGIVSKAGYTLKPGDIVEVHMPDSFLEASETSTPQQLEVREIPILYEDERILIVNKPVGIAAHQGAGVKSFTVVDFLRSKISAQNFLDPSRAGIVHRLDKDTSGVLICAKDPTAQRVISKMFHDRLVEKTYLSMNHVGKRSAFLKSTDGLIRCWIRRDSANRKRFKCFTEPISSSKEALTNYRVVFVKDGVALVELKPITGRTHQLRAQAVLLNSPILNDSIYATGFSKSLPPQLNLQIQRAKRLFLHAYSIRFINPFSGREIKAIAPVPMEFVELASFLECREFLAPYLKQST